MNKWLILKKFIKEGTLAKEILVSRPYIFKEILDLMEELETREEKEIDNE